MRLKARLVRLWSLRTMKKKLQQLCSAVSDILSAVNPAKWHVNQTPSGNVIRVGTEAVRRRELIQRRTEADQLIDRDLIGDCRSLA